MSIRSLKNENKIEKRVKRVKFFRFSSLLCTGARPRNEINNPDNSPFRELSFGLKE